MEVSALRRQRAATLPRSRRLLAALGDDRLVDQVRRGNAAAFEVLYDRHYRGILSFCRHMLGSHDEAEDAVQQTFTSAFTGLRSNDRDIRLKAWLYTIARNRCLSILRARREEASELEDVPTTGLSEQVQQRADLRELLYDLRELPDDQREALVLFELGDLSQSEVASVIGVEPVKVKALVFQARSALIENREARAIPCAEIREQLATATGGALRRGPLRRHLKSCEGCSEYRDHVRSQRRALALVLPVVPSVGLRESVLGALGFGGGAGGGGVAAGGGGVAAGAGAAGSSGGGVFAAIGGMSAAKLAVGATLGVGALAGGGVVVERAVDDGGSSESAQAAEKSGDQGDGGGKAAAAAATGTPVVNGHGPRAGDDTGNEKSRDGKKDKDDRKPGDEKGEKGGRSNGAGNSGDRGSSRSRGNRGSRSTGGSNGRRIGRRVGGNARNGDRGRRAPQGPRPGAGGGNSGNAPSRSGGTTGTPATTPTTPTTPSTESGSRGTTRGAPIPVAPTDGTSTVESAE